MLWGDVFGGFSSAPWESHGGYKPSAGAFLFSLRRPGGVSPVKLALKADHEQYAVHFNASHGPLSGGGLDISVLTLQTATKKITRGSLPTRSYRAISVMAASFSQAPKLSGG